jgi:hypothetical protein
MLLGAWCEGTLAVQRCGACAALGLGIVVKRLLDLRLHATNTVTEADMDLKAVLSHPQLPEWMQLIRDAAQPLGAAATVHHVDVTCPVWS